MKKILSLLVIFVFLNVQARAYYPAYSAQGLNPVGTYGGTLVPGGTATASTNGVSSADSLGIFSLGVPQTGLSTGSFAIFIQGAAYVGQIVGYVDPNSQAYSAILNGASLFTVTVTVLSTPPTTITYNINVSGNMEATFAQSTNASGTALSTTLTGTATVITFSQVNADGSPEVTGTQTFSVNGTQQSATVNPTTITLTGNTSGG